MSLTTLQECINGRRCVLESNSEKSWLDDAEGWGDCEGFDSTAQQGFPDTKRHLCARVNAVTQDELGGPIHSVWERFGLTCGWKSGESGSAHIGQCYPGLLWEGSADRPPVQHRSWMHVDNGSIKLCIWSCMQDQGDWADRERAQQSVGTGRLQRYAPHLCWCMPPCVIFQGQKLNSIWSEPENNPLQCPYILSLCLEHTDFQQDLDVWEGLSIPGHWEICLQLSDRGYIANGHTRLLIVDGHRSHFNYELLDHAQNSWYYCHIPLMPSKVSYFAPALRNTDSVGSWCTGILTV